MCTGSRPALKLYRLCLKGLREIPKEARGYYREHTRQTFRNYRDETDSERAKGLIAHGERSIVWILDKYRAGSPVRRI